MWREGEPDCVSREEGNGGRGEGRGLRWPSILNLLPCLSPYLIVSATAGRRQNSGVQRSLVHCSLWGCKVRLDQQQRIRIHWTHGQAGSETASKCKSKCTQKETEGQRQGQKKRGRCHPDRRETEEEDEDTEKQTKIQRQRQQGTRTQGSGERKLLGLANRKTYLRQGVPPEAGGLGEGSGYSHGYQCQQPLRLMQNCIRVGKAGSVPQAWPLAGPQLSHQLLLHTLCVKEEESWRSKAGRGPVISPWMSHLLLFKTFIYLFSCAARISVS